MRILAGPTQTAPRLRNLYAVRSAALFAVRPTVLFIFLLVPTSGLARAAIGGVVSLSHAPAPRAIAVSGPSLDPPAEMRVHAGQVSDQVVHATDVDGDALTFLFNAGPAYMTVTTTDPGAGEATGNIHLAPSLLDTGRTTGILGVYDGTFYRVASFGITVFPALAQPADMTVSEGTTADQTLIGFDSDGYALTFTLVSGPRFAAVTTTSDSTGNIHLAPGFEDSGYHVASISISDGVAVHTSAFQILVNNVYRPPALAQPADMHGIPNTISEQILTVSNPDGMNLTYSKVAGPGYVSVGELSLYPPRGYVRLDSPSMADTGSVMATVSVSDGTSSDQKSFRIRVDLDDRPPVLALRDIDMTEGADLDQAVVAFDPDGQRLSISTSELPRFMSLTPHVQPFGYDSVVARIRLSPTYDDAGAYSVVFRVSDGWMEVTDTLHVTVRNAGSGETSLRLGVLAAGGGTFECEYSAVEGVYAVYEPSPESLNFGFAATSGSGAHWTITFAGPLIEGSYSTGEGPVYFNISGTDTTARPLVSCFHASTSYRIRRIARRIDGSILSFWATFQQVCPDGSPGFHGEVRYQVTGIPITLVAPRWIPGGTNSGLGFLVTAVDVARDTIALSASGLPAGASFLDNGGGQGAFSWTPARLQAGNYLVRFTATSAGGLADTAFTTVHIVSGNKSPRAFANGPYIGNAGVPVPFTSSGTTDPEGDPLTYHWTFGDGGSADAADPLHAYLLPGPYPVSLVVRDGLLAGGDQTLATIYWPDSARVFQVLPNARPDPEPLVLQAGGGRFCVGIEIVDAPTTVIDIDRFSLRLRLKGPGAIDGIAADPTTLLLGDADGNGVPDVTACFTRDDLRRLFGDIRGRLRVGTTIEFSLGNGHGFHASLPVDVIGPEGRLRVLMAPNPFRTAGMFSFVTSAAGPARLTLFDGSGRIVRTVLDAESLPTGYHDIPLDARGEGGRTLPSGIYFYRLETKEGTRTGRLAIIR